MRIEFSKQFKKNFKKRVVVGSTLESKYQERLAIFIENRQNPLIKDHKLTGKMQMLRAFWITGDIRVVYFLEAEGIVTFVNIGSHNQVYS